MHRRANTILIIVFLLFAKVFLGVQPCIAHESVSIACCGDVNFSGTVERIAQRNGYDYFFSGSKEIISGSTVAFCNLETAVSVRGKAKEKEYTFRSKPVALKSLKNAGFDVVSIANNHTLDFGYDALFDTIKNLKDNGFYFAGAGKNRREAENPAVIELESGRKIALFAFSDVIPPGFMAGEERAGVASLKDFRRASQIVRDYRKKNPKDLILVSVHWGIELEQKPNKRQIDIAHLLIDCGADAVLGHHPHVYQSIEIYKGKPVIYSAGNFVFSSASPKTRLTAVAVLNYSEGLLSYVEVYPMVIKAARPAASAAGLAALKPIIEARGTKFQIREGKLITIVRAYLYNGGLKQAIRFERMYFKDVFKT